MEDNTKKKALSDEELMDVSGGLSINIGGTINVCPKCGQKGICSGVTGTNEYRFVCTGCENEWTSQNPTGAMKSVVMIAP